MRSWLTENKGSLTLETAVVLPLLCFYILSLYALAAGFRADMLWQEAGRSAIKEAALATVLFKAGAEGVPDQVANAEDLMKIIGKAVEDGLSSALLTTRQRHWFSVNTKDDLFLRFFIKDPFGYIERIDDRLYYSFTYRQILDPALSLRAYRLPLPYWGGIDFKNASLDTKKIESEEEKKDNDIWSENALTRGQYFRQTEGANLPASYPVVAFFDKGRAVSIKSVDLTAPTYASGTELRKKISGHLNELGSFEGTENWGQEGITIAGTDIRERVLKLIIPENSPPLLLNVLAEEKAAAEARGFTIEWVARGESGKYKNN